MTTHKEALEAAYLAGFNASGEGYNGEYPFGDKMQDPAENRVWKKNRDNYIKEALAQQSNIFELKEKTSNHNVDCLCADCSMLDDLEDAQPEQEPVAYIHRNEYNEYRLEPHDNFDIKSIPFNVDVLLFKAPQRKPLTVEQRNEIARQADENDWHDYDIIDAVEAAHGIKGEA